MNNIKFSKYFDEVISSLNDDKESIKLASNYIAVDLAGLSQKAEFEVFPDSNLISELVGFIRSNKLSSRGAKDALLYTTLKENEGKTIEQIANEKGLIQVSDTGALEKVIDTIIVNNEKVVLEYKAGKVASLQFLLGQAMKETKGSANPGILRELFVKKLG